MVYVCAKCDNIYAHAPEGGCQGSRLCAKENSGSLTWYPNTSVREAKRKLENGTLRDDPTDPSE